jgi:hypothetical protein
MKICKKCLHDKDDEEFYKQTQRGLKGEIWYYLDSYCKKCRIEYTVDRSRRIKTKAVEYLGGKCVDCGLIDDVCVYDFHHEDPTKKEFSFGQRGGISFEKIKPELDKCILLCSNCHRKRHSIIM